MAVNKTWLSLAALLVACAAACEDDEIDGCTPGVSSRCTCDGGGDGTQLCRADNTYGKCECSGSAGTGGGGGSGGSGGTTGGSGGSGATGGAGGSGGSAGGAGASGAAGAGALTLPQLLRTTTMRT